MGVSRPQEIISRQVVTATLPLKSPGNHDQVTQGATCVIYEVEAVDTTPVVKVYVKSSASGTWRKWRSWQQAVDSTIRTERAPDASITLVAGDQIIVPTAGFYAVRLDLQSGTGYTTVARTSDEFGVADLLEVLVKSASALDTNIIKHNGTEYQVTRVGGALTATGSLVPATSAKYGVLLYLLLIPEDGVDDTFRLSDSGGDLLGTSAVPIPLSSDGGAAGAAGFGFNFPYGIKTTGVNRAITITFGGSGTFAYYAVYALTTD